MVELDELKRRALAWADADCDETTAQQCREMAARGDLAELRDHFAGHLEFGTAGLRAKVGPGPWRMNRATVRRAARAVADHLKAAAASSDDIPCVVVAFDARQSSRELATEACGTLRAAGVHVRAFPVPTPTPVAAFALTYEAARAAIVITASHNPKEYNGFKLYGADGAQIVAPTDLEIAARMTSLGRTRDIPCSVAELTADAGQALGEATVDAYFRALQPLVAAGERQIRIAYTPLHGLGAPFVERALHSAGFMDVSLVGEQREPDGEFPTVPFPNPEEPAVMSRLFALAETIRAHVALANDPDVDRLAVGIPNADGKFVALSGNQVGVLLADFLLRRHRASGDNRTPLVVQSVVSSPLLRAIAEDYGARYERTLTGFKWIARPGIAAPASDAFVFGYEEAIGYSVLPQVHDKDGISAALLMAELVDTLHARGLTVSDALLDLYRKHGLWVSAQTSVTLPGAAGIARIRAAMDQLRTRPPTTVGDVVIVAHFDYASGAEARPSWLPAADLIELDLGESGRLLVRPSGTEPKLKIYADIRGAAPARLADLTTAGADAAQVERDLVEKARHLAHALQRQLGLE